MTICAPDTNGIDWPAWIQAGTSITTILIAFVVVNYQHRKDVQRALDEERAKALDQLQKVKTLASLALQHIEENMRACVNPGDAMAFYKARMDINKYAHYREVLCRYPTAEIGNASMLALYLDLIAVYQTFYNRIPVIHAHCSSQEITRQYYDDFFHDLERARACSDAMERVIQAA